MKLSVWMGQNPHLFHTSVIVSVEVSVNRVGRDELYVGEFGVFKSQIHDESGRIGHFSTLNEPFRALSQPYSDKTHTYSDKNYTS
jgi:hypothetical protein